MKKNIKKFELCGDSNTRRAEKLVTFIVCEDKYIKNPSPWKKSTIRVTEN